MGLVISLPLFGSEESSAVSCAVALTVAAKPIHIAHSVDAAARIEVLNLTDREQCITKPSKADSTAFGHTAGLLQSGSKRLPYPIGYPHRRAFLTLRA